MKTNEQTNNLYFVKKVYPSGVQTALSRAEVIAACHKTAPSKNNVDQSLPFGSKCFAKASRVAAGMLAPLCSNGDRVLRLEVC